MPSPPLNQPMWARDRYYKGGTADNMRSFINIPDPAAIQGRAAGRKHHVARVPGARFWGCAHAC